MKIKVVVHEAEEGGYWAEVPALPGCATQGETFEELLTNLHEAIEGCLSVHGKPVARLVPATGRNSIAAGTRAALFTRLRSQRALDIGRWSRDELYKDAG